MKKIAIILSIVAAVCCGCWKTEGFVMPQYGIYRSWEFATRNVLTNYVELAFIGNAWINGNDSVRRAIEDEYLPYQRIRHEGGNEYGIYNGSTLQLLINTGGKAIDEADANWLITNYQGGTDYDGTRPIFCYSGKHTRLEIRHTGVNEWNVRLDSVSCDGSTSDWTISVPGTETPVSLTDIPYTFNGSGIYMLDGTSVDGNYTRSPITMRYTVTETLNHKVGTPATFESGILDIIVSKADCDDRAVRVDFSTGDYILTSH